MHIIVTNKLHELLLTEITKQTINMKFNLNTFSILFLSILFISSCKNNTVEPSLPANLSQNEDKGLKEIIRTYGGVIHFDKGAIAATADNKKTRIFEVSLANSTKVDEQAKNTSLIASNLAWLMYKNMGADANNYDEIHAILTIKENKTTTKFPVADLKIVAKKMEVLNKMIALIKADKLEELRPFLNNTDLIEYPKDEILAELNFRSKTNGKITGFTPAGFKRNKSSDGKPILQISGILNREKLDHPISIAADMQSDKEEVLFLQFML